MRSWESYQAVYVHVPFCVRKCLYCDFTSYANCGNVVQEQYVNMLCREMADRANSENSERRLPITQGASVFFGGGTPSLLPVGLLEKLVAAMKGYGFWREPAEATLEANPGTVDLEKLKRLRELGFDRISFGVQSLNAGELRSIGRIHNPKQALEALEWAQKAGFARINADLMYGLPGQTLASYESTVKQMVSLGLKHISAYSLILEENTPLEQLVLQGKLQLPEEDMVADMYEFTNDYLPSKGLLRYEISNYAAPGQESRHNQQYWRYHPYAAIGVAACEFTGKERFTHTASVQEYLQNWQKGMERENLSQEELLEEYMFMGLRQTRGVDLAEAEERFGVRITDKFALAINKFAGQGMLVLNEEKQLLKPTAKGMTLGNQLFEAFML